MCYAAFHLMKPGVMRVQRLRSALLERRGYNSRLVLKTSFAAGILFAALEELRLRSAPSNSDDAEDCSPMAIEASDAIPQP